MENTLRQIADAFVQTGAYPPPPNGKSAKDELYGRARMLRDRGLLRSSVPPTQGRTTLYNEADVVAAVSIIAASLSGWSWGLIGMINQELRPFDSAKRPREFERYLSEIKIGSPVIIRVEVVSTPWGYVNVRMGEPESVRAQDTVGESVLSRNELPVTDLALPILKHLEAAQ